MFSASFALAVLRLGPSSFTALDWSLIGLFLFLPIVIACITARRGHCSAEDYFLAGRNLPWWLVGTSLFSANIGAEHVVGLVGAGAQHGVVFAHYELHAWCLLVLAWVFVPYYARAHVSTVPEFLEKRFSPPCRTVLATASLALFVLVKLAVGLFAGGLVFSVLLPELHWRYGTFYLDSFWLGSIAVILLTGLSTLVGGLRAIAYTSLLQVIILVGGAATLTVFGLRELGGWDELRRLCGSDMFNLWRPLVPEGVTATWAPVREPARLAWYFNADFPWLGMLFCAPIIGLWYWCTDQYIVQRTLSARDEGEARRGALFAAVLKLTPIGLFIVPGLICFALGASGRNPALAAELFPGGKFSPEAAQAAFPLMVQHLLPPGVRGLVVASLLAALMSSLAGVFHACSSVWAQDIWPRFCRACPQNALIRRGRWATVVLICIALAWIPLIRHSSGLYLYLQTVQSFLAPPIFVVFFLGVFWKRLNASGALAALLVGFALGALRLAIDAPVTLGLLSGSGYEPGSFPWFIHHLNFQYYSLLITAVSALVMILVSYLTPPPAEDRLAGLTYRTVTPDHRQASRATWSRRDLFVSALVFGFILFAYITFRG